MGRFPSFSPCYLEGDRSLRKAQGGIPGDSSILEPVNQLAYNTAYRMYPPLILPAEKALGEHRDKDPLENKARNGLEGRHYGLWTIREEWR